MSERSQGLVAAVIVAVAAGALLAAGMVWMKPAEAAERHTVEMRNFVYAPARLEVEVGDTVVWVNRDVAPHTVTDAAGGWDSGSVGANGDWRMVVGSAGEIPYVCAFHPAMTGVLVVRDGQDESESGGL